MNLRTHVCLALLAFSLTACGEDSTKPPFDIAGLTSARTAVPDSDSVVAVSPGGMAEGTSGLAVQPLLGERALYPTWTAPLVLGVNTNVRQVIRTLDFVTSLDPTRYDEAKATWWWGPYPNEEGAGNIAAYIRQEGDSADFRYTYGFVRSDADTGDGRKVVLFGGTNPNPSGRGYGNGVIVWNFTANREFDEARGETPQGPTGRFAALFDRTRDADHDADRRVVLAVFRDFADVDQGDAPVDLDYFYGNIRTDEHRLRFLNYRGQFDVYDGDNDPDTNEPTQPEDNDVRLVFVDGGMGRAEAAATGGDVARGDVAGVALHECWNDAIQETYLGQAAIDTDGNELWRRDLGTEADCGGPFAQPLANLPVPSLDDVDGALRAALDDIATHGAPE